MEGAYSTTSATGRQLHSKSNSSSSFKLLSVTRWESSELIAAKNRTTTSRLTPPRYTGLNFLRNYTIKRILLSQPHMINILSQRFGLPNPFFSKTRSSRSNLLLHYKLTTEERGREDCFPYLFKEAVYTLLFIELTTRPAIMHAAWQVFRYCQNPNRHYWDAITQTFTCPNGTMDYGIWLGGNRKGLRRWQKRLPLHHPRDFLLPSRTASWSSKKQPYTASDDQLAEIFTKVPTGQKLTTIRPNTCLGRNSL